MAYPKRSLSANLSGNYAVITFRRLWMTKPILHPQLGLGLSGSVIAIFVIATAMFVIAGSHVLP
jgi:hypothetical protein